MQSRTLHRQVFVQTDNIFARGFRRRWCLLSSLRRPRDKPIWVVLDRDARFRGFGSEQGEIAFHNLSKARLLY